MLHYFGTAKRDEKILANVMVRALKGCHGRE